MAAFAATPAQGAAPLTVQFNDLSQPGSAAITDWSWDFGDGGSATQHSPEHTYTDAGVYDVALTVTTPVASNSTTQEACVTVQAEEEFEPGAELDLLDEAMTHYETLLDTGTAQEARADMVDWFVNQRGVEDAGTASSGTTIWVHFETGVSAAMLTESYIDDDLEMQTRAAGTPADARTRHAKLGAQTYYMAPFRFQQPNWGETISLQNHYRDPHTNMQLGVELVDSEVTVDAVRGFLQLQMLGAPIPSQLIWSGHGGVTRIRGLPGENMIVATGERVTAARYQQEYAALKAGRLVLSLIQSIKKKHFCFSPAFIRHWSVEAPDDQWHWLNRYVYLATCYSGHPSMSSAFIDAGAVYYAGYDGPIYKSFHTQTGITFFDYLIQGETVLDAHTYTTPKTDPRAGGTFVVEQVGTDVRLFYRGFFWLDGVPMATSTHTWLTLGDDGRMGGPCFDVLDDYCGAVTVQLDDAATGQQPIEEGSDATILYIDTQGRDWRASGSSIEEHNAPCGGHIEVLEFEATSGTPVRGEIEATLAYRQPDETWAQKEFVGNFSAINQIGVVDLFEPLE